jgi:hypothetical protein
VSYLGKFQDRILRVAPWYLRQKNIGTLLEAIGLTLDGNVDGLLVGMRRGYPLRCTPDAFADLSKDRKIRLYPNESDQSKRFRLAHWRQIRRTRGCHYGEMINIQPFFLGPGGATVQPNGDQYLPTIRIVHQSGDPGGGPIATWHQLDPFGGYTWTRPGASNWNWDGQTAKWSRWGAIIFLPSNFTGADVYDGGDVYDAGATYDGVSSALVSDLVQGLIEAKAAHSRLSWVIATTLQPGSSIPGFPGRHPFDPNDVAITLPDGSTTLPVGNWGNLVNNLNQPTRPPWASFLYWDNG